MMNGSDFPRKSLFFKLRPLNPRLMVGPLIFLPAFFFWFIFYSFFISTQISSCTFLFYRFFSFFINLILFYWLFVGPLIFSCTFIKFIVMCRLSMKSLYHKEEIRIIIVSIYVQITLQNYFLVHQLSSTAANDSHFSTAALPFSAY